MTGHGVFSGVMTNEPNSRSNGYPFVPKYEAITEEVRERIEFLLSAQLGRLKSAVFIQPTKKDAILCLDTGLRLESVLRLKWEQRPEPVDISLPLPYHGVFIFTDKDTSASKDHESRKGLWSWLPRLARKPGVWQICRPSLSFPTPIEQNKQSPSRLEIAFDSSARFFFKYSTKDKRYAFDPKPVASHKQDVLLWRTSDWPSALIHHLGHSGEDHLLVHQGNDLVTLVENIVTWASTHQDQLPLTCGDELASQALFTFESWLLEQVPIRLAYEISSQPTGSLSARMGMSLVPIRLLRKQGRLLLFNPNNPIDAVSQLTRLDRYGLKSGSLDYLRPVIHQNHPSFFGPICPVETPESTMVGITLHLSRAPRSGSALLSINPKEIAPRECLGYAANLIPFFEYNDGSRNMMGAKNLKQVLPIAGGRPPAIDPDGGAAILNAVAPLIELGIVPNMQDAKGNLTTGTDLLVAYMPFEGLNFEDGVVARAGIAKDLGYVTQETITQRIPSFYRRATYSDKQSFALYKGLGLDDELLVKPGTAVRRGDPLAILIDTRSEENDELVDKTIRYAFLEEAVIISASLTVDPIGGGRLTVVVNQTFPLSSGDKIMGRHGNKGVISRLLPDDKMPRLPDDPSLPEVMRNRPVDLILNPHGVISRMNIGQLLEVHLGWLHYAGAPLSPPMDSSPFAQQAHARAKDISTALADTGLDKNGRIKLVLPGNSPTVTEMPVVVGFQHIVRLRHIPIKKIHARHKGTQLPYDPITGQPVQGRHNLGGQRMGEMEIWALSAHGATALLNDLLQDRSHDGNCPASKLHTWATVRDHFFAIGVDINREDEKLKFSVLEKAPEKWSMGEVTSKDLMEPTLTAKFRCPTCKETPKHITHTYEVMAAENPTLSLGVFLNKQGLSWAKPPKTTKRNGDEVSADWHLTTNEGNRIVAKVHCEAKKSTLLLGITIPSPAKNDVLVIHCWIRTHSKKIKGATLESLFSPKNNKRGTPLSIEDVSITCETHQSKALGAYATKQSWRGASGGPYCTKVFGDDLQDRKRWGHIVLPKPIVNPLFAKLPRYKDGEGKPPLLKAIPILPLVYRRRWQNDPEKSPRADELTRNGYIPVIEAFEAYERYKKTNNKEGMSASLSEIEKSISKLFDLLVNRISEKETGLIRQHSLGRRTDRSGRAVIVPAPELNPDQCRVPARILAAIAGDEIAKDVLKTLSEKERPPEIEALAAGRFPTGHLQEKALKVIREYFARHPEKLVLLNRQPSLHKYSILAFRPIVSDEESVIGLHPLACAPLGADFDGDEITIHWPASDAAQNDAKKLLLENNLLSVANGNGVIQFSQDLVLGFFLLRHAERHQPVLDILPSDCRATLRKASIWTAKEINATLTEIAKKHGRQALAIYQALMTLSIQAATAHGTSFGYFDCLACRPTVAEIQAQESKCLPKKPGEKPKDPAFEATMGKLKSMLMADQFVLGRDVAEMVVSKARGEKQITQIAVRRGNLAPGLTSFPTEARDFNFSHALAEGCDAETFFRTAYNNRSSQCDKKLGTGIAGGITRQMAGLLWDVTSNGNRIGLWAAQSIGERGTQLSMQSFHTGKGAVNISTAKQVLLKRTFDSPEALLNALVEENDESPYLPLDKEHFSVLWKRRSQKDSGHKSVLQELAFSSKEKIIKVALEAALNGTCDDISHPVAAVMLSNLPTPDKRPHGTD